MMVAPCGLECEVCPQRTPELCGGCHAENGPLWCADCRIRVCCKYERKLSNCSECDGFPCERILAFEADKWEHHTAAVQRLRDLHG